MLARFAAAVLLLASLLSAQPSAPLVIDNQPLWTFKASRAGFSPAERAQDITENLIHLAEDPRRQLDDVREVVLETETVLLVSHVYLFSVTDEDARLEARTRADLFAERKRILLDALNHYRQRRTFGSLLRSLALSAGALLGTILLLALLRYFYRRLSAWAIRYVSVRSRSSRVASIFRIFETPVRLLLRGGLQLCFLSLALLVVLGSLSYVFSLFPTTAGLSGTVAAKAWDVVLTAVANLVGYLPNLLVLVLVALFTYVLIRIARTLAHAIDAGAVVFRSFHRDWAKPTYDLVKVLLLLFSMVVAFPYLPGGESPALKGASIFIGVLVSLGSGSAMGNVVSGVILTYMRPFRVGDRVQIADTTGDVVEKSLLVTRIRTIKNVEVIVPNSAVLGAHILNYSSQAEQHGLILNTTVTLGYDAPWRTVESLLINAALRTPGILAEPAPFVLQTSLNDSHISYQLNAFTKDANRMAELYSCLHRNIQDQFNEGGVEIMSPMYLSVRDGNTITIPEANRPGDYRPSSFRVRSDS